MILRFRPGLDAHLEKPCELLGARSSATLDDGCGYRFRRSDQLRAQAGEVATANAPRDVIDRNDLGVGSAPKLQSIVIAHCRRSHSTCATVSPKHFCRCQKTSYAEGMH